jgi:transcriptional repressor NrdR
MQCPVCAFEHTKVIDTRAIDSGMHIRRRRECEKPGCAFRFSTLEEIELLDTVIVKRDGARQVYSKEKLVSGLRKALEKRNHSEKAFRRLILDIERDIQKHRSRELTSAGLGDIVIDHLRQFDKVAYIRFASVYYSFEDLETFEAELEKLSRKRKKRS